MSELHIALIAVAALVLLALYVSGKWQERRLVRRMRDRMHGGVRDALLGEGQSPVMAEGSGAGGAQRARRDPTFSASLSHAGDARAQAQAFAAVQADADADGAQDEPAEDDTEPGADDDRAGGGPSRRGSVTSEVLRTPSALLQPNWAEDPLLDCTLEIGCSRAVDGVSVIDAAAALAHAPWRLPVHFVVWDGRNQEWVLPDRFGYYSDALASIQLADRRARIDEAELVRFVETVQQVARTLDADVDPPDVQRLLVQAQELDRLCARFDIKIGITVESTGPAWTGPQLRNCAQQTGFVPTSGQHWVRYDARGDVLYTLQVDPARMNRVALEFDIAVAPVEAQGFRAMVEGANALAGALGARVVDDNGAPIEARSVDAIDAQLARVVEEMRAAGIEPGSARARRLYV